MDRRQALKTLAAAAAARLAAQPPPPQAAKKPPAPANPQNQRRAPMIVVFSQCLSQIEYPELGDIVMQMGFDGVDLTIRPGGHVDPRLANVDLVRAFEVMEGNGLSVPVVTTALTTPMDRTALPVLALAGMSGAHVFRPGSWPSGNNSPSGNNPNVMLRLAEVQRDFAGLITIGRQYTIGGAFYNQAGDNVGATVSDVQRILQPLDPAWAGFYFDICNATGESEGAWENALRIALPRIKAVTIQDFTWEKRDGRRQMIKCPLGQGVVEWPRFFQILAQAGYLAPVTLEIAYPSRDMPAALENDLQFARKQLQTAYGLVPKT